ncbi:type 1 glutamine amidotransferase [Pontiella sp.]|uniref:type 1 glutamine amidotransferase n=1 Tax=Pontiella sp. TaxID=2837462 RepID=UPI00356A7564
MKLHWLQHVPFESLGYIEDWAEDQGFSISCTRLYDEEDEFPDVDDFDWLVIMGGPMGIFDYNDYPWLTDEKEFIETALDEEKTVIGICLGAQLMADVLGAKVFPGPQKEIGWFPVTRSPEAPDLIPESLTVFHWHGDTFEIPDGAVPLAVSEAGINQGFVFENHAVALQFHMEITGDGIEDLIQECGDELDEAPYIQTAAEIKAGFPNLGTVNAAMKKLLDALL